MKKSHLFLTLSILAISFSYGQRVENSIAKSYNTYRAEQPAEFSYLRTDKKIYFNGESIGFSLTILDSYFTPSQLSKIAYLELIHENGKFRKKFAFKLNNGISNGHLNIPLEIPTGNYQLVAYTYFMNNFEFDRAIQRRLIYIQNSSEPIEAVAKSFEPTYDSNEDDLPYTESGFLIRKNETNTKVLFEISSPRKITEECFIVSEGYMGVQFIARTKLNKAKTNLSIKKDQFSGSFQKIILLDNNLEVLTAKAFYFDEPAEPVLYHEVTKDSVRVESRKTLLGKIEMTSEALHQDSIDLFRRIYQLYYNVPSRHGLSELSFEQLVSDSTLSNFSNHIARKWTRIMSKQIPDLTYRPERNLHLRGQIEGDLSRFEGGVFGVHFFENGLDFFGELDEAGNVDVEIFWPITTDQFYCSITDSRSREVSDQFKITFDSGPEIPYGANQSFYPRELTDSLIENHMEFSYILSTFSPLEKKDKFFWQAYSMDRVVKVDDYRGLTDFEEVIREAVIDLSVSKVDGVKSVKIYNTYEGSFRKPQMIVLNNQILNSTVPFFDIPIEKLKSIRMIYSKEQLDDFGKIFFGGVVIVETVGDYPISEEYIDQKTGFVVGFTDGSNLNQISQSFNWSKLLKLYTNDQISIRMDNKEKGKYEFSFEAITKDGRYESNLDRIMYD